MAARLSSAGKASKIPTPPTTTKIVARKRISWSPSYQFGICGTKVLENLPVLPRNQCLAHSHSSSRVADLSSTKAVRFSSACATKRLPPPRCSSAFACRVAGPPALGSQAQFATVNLLSAPRPVTGRVVSSEKTAWNRTYRQRDA